MLRPDHPLTSRVAVNRIWKIFFGRGIVRTQEDFGGQGDLPSHPDLLDYLAAHFMRSRWDVKALCRMIVTSATYRQASTPHSDLVARDADNALLARGPNHRYSAEQIRDATLAASGMLSRRVGGPSVKPYQPAGLWKEVGPEKYEPSSGESLYRRSMYTFWKRTVPHPAMVSFDAVSREVCVARRETTLTPTQALILLNDPQFVEPSRVLASTLLKKHGQDISGALEEAFRRFIGRRPRDHETQELHQFFAQQQRLFAINEKDAASFIGVGSYRRDDSLPAADVAALASVVQLVINFYEFQVKL